MAMEAEWLGQRVEVYWPSDEEWFRGRVTEYDAKSNKYQVDYDDGESVSLSLCICTYIPLHLMYVMR